MRRLVIAVAFVACGGARVAARESAAPLPAIAKTSVAPPVAITSSALAPPAAAGALPSAATYARIRAARAAIDRLSKADTTPATTKELADQWAELAAVAVDAHTKKVAHEHAVESYRLVEDRFPAFGSIDEVYLHHAGECARVGETNEAQQLYYVIIRRFPKARSAPNAYYALGEDYFSRSLQDPAMLDFAAAAYAEVVKYPAPFNTLHGEATYKLALLDWGKGDYAKALAKLKNVSDFAFQYPAIAGAGRLGTTARNDAVTVYARSGKADRAYDFFLTLVYDPDHALALEAALGEAYLRIDAHADAVAVCRDVARRDPSHERRCSPL